MVVAKEADIESSFLEEMNDIRAFRNQVAHAHTYVQSPSDVRQLVTRFRNIQKWIKSVSSLVIVRPHDDGQPDSAIGEHHA